MKVTVSRPVEIEVTAVRIDIPVRDEEDGMAKDFPFRKSDTWTAIIDIDTGRIRDWPAPVGEFSLFEKVVDGGTYTLLDATDREVAKIEQDYVPGIIPGQYGDYVHLKIKDGVVVNWPNEPDLEDFFD